MRRRARRRRRLPAACLPDPFALVRDFAVLPRPPVDDGAPRRPSHDASAAPAALFAWSGGGIVLLGERGADRWLLARGWRHGDRLCDVRRWSFGDPRAFAGQVRRLVRDATADPGAATDARDAALAWIGDDPSGAG